MDNSENSPRRESPTTAVERAIAFLAVGIASLALLTLLGILLAGVFGAEVGGEPQWLWQTLISIVYFGFPAAFLLVVTLVIMRTFSNRRANRSA